MASRDGAISGGETSRELHPVLAPDERRRLILEGLELFNAGRYYECHEAWETVWRSTTPEPRDLWRGLIQVGVAFYHLHSRRRPDVALRVLRKGRRRVEPFAPRAVGLDLEALLESVERWDRHLENDGPRPATPRLKVVDDRACR